MFAENDLHHLSINNWIMIADRASLERWKPKDILPTAIRLMDMAEKTMAKSDCMLSNTFRIPVKDHPTCHLILFRIPLNPVNPGYIWMGLESQEQEFREQIGNAPTFKQFSLPPIPSDVSMN